MSTFSGHFDEFPDWRADRFTAPESGKPQTCDYLLSHIHSDHLQGLNSKKFQGNIYCTELTEKLLRSLEPNLERVKYDVGLLPKRTQPYRFKSNRDGTPRVNFFLLAYDTPVWVIKAYNRLDYRLTALDAGHCPGSCMFLVESFDKSPAGKHGDVLKAILYSGDIRADPDWLAALARKPCLQPYLAGDSPFTDSAGKRVPRRPLDNIYLDTSASLSRAEVLSRTEAISRTLHLICQYPPDAKFFINLWTPGYEDFVEALYDEFRQPIHVDRYKLAQFKHVYGLVGTERMFTRDSKATRFHACDRNFKCDEVWNEGRGCFIFDPADQKQMQFKDPRDLKRKTNAGCGCSADTATCKGAECASTDAAEGLVVYVNPAEPFSRSRWGPFERQIQRRLDLAKREPGAEWPRNLLLPLSRHSCLPELRALVSLFRPHCLFPNTIYDSINYLDYFILPQLFADCLSDDAKRAILTRAKLYAFEESRRRGRDPPEQAYTATFDNMRETIQLTYTESIAQAGLLNFAGPDHFEAEIRRIIEGPMPTSNMALQTVHEEPDAEAEVPTPIIKQSPLLPDIPSPSRQSSRSSFPPQTAFAITPPFNDWEYFRVMKRRLEERGFGPVGSKKRCEGLGLHMQHVRG